MEGIRQALAIVFVFGLLAACVWRLRRAGPPALRLRGGGRRSRRRMEAVERLPLTPQHSLHLVRVGSKGFLVAAHPGGCAVLASAGWQDLEEAIPCEPAA